jgi:hypothetical protein
MDKSENPMIYLACKPRLNNWKLVYGNTDCKPLKIWK